MTELLALLVLSVATNLDNFAVGVGYAVRGRRIGWRPNLLIACLNAAGTGVALASGNWLASRVPEAAADWAGGLLFLALGAWSLWDVRAAPPHPAGEPAAAASVHFFSQRPVEASPQVVPPLSDREAWMLGLSLTLSNLLSGFGAGLQGLSFTWAVGIMWVMSLVGISVGCGVGRVVHSLVSVRWAGVVAGWMLVGLGVWRLVSA